MVSGSSPCRISGLGLGQCMGSGKGWCGVHLAIMFPDSINDRRDHSIPWGLTQRLLQEGLFCLSIRVVPRMSPKIQVACRC
jgi:hypothetical protein